MCVFCDLLFVMDMYPACYALGTVSDKSAAKIP